jgi:hypothetical protein
VVSFRIPSLVLAFALCALLASVAGAAPKAVTRPGGPGGPAPAFASPGGPGPVTPHSGEGQVKGNMTLVYGDDHVFGVVPPPGWVVDDSSGLGSKIRVVLYPRGQKWATAPIVMYSNPLHQDPRARKSFAQMLERDAADFRRQSPHGKVTSGPPIHNVKGQTAEVRYFAPDGREPLTAVAYYEEKELVMLLVLDSKTPAGFRQTLPLFNGMVSSYQFVASSVPTPTHKTTGH